MSSSKITLYGVASYLDGMGDDLFKNLTLPDGITKKTLTDNIILKGAEFEVLYSDPYFFQEAIGTWSNKWNRTFTKWIEALNIEFEPLENYDRREEWTDNTTGTNTGTVTESGSNSNTGTVTNSGTNNSTLNQTVSSTDSTTGTGNSSDQISAFNSDTMRNNTASSTSNSTDSETSATTTGTNNITIGNTRTDNLESTSENVRTDNLTNTQNTVRSGRAHGNIGVTTSTQMLEDYLRVEQWNIYEHVTDIFLSEFVIPIY